MTFRDAVRHAMLQPRPDDLVVRPSREQLRRLPRPDRRRAKIAYEVQAGGQFRTWVYAVTLVGILGLFVLFVALAG